jgi:hypothetical protein
MVFLPTARFHAGGQYTPRLIAHPTASCSILDFRNVILGLRIARIPADKNQLSAPFRVIRGDYYGVYLKR